MPYFVTEQGQHPDCSGYGVVKDDFELLGCHETKQSAIDQMVAISIAEGIEPGGTYTEQERSDANVESEAREACGDSCTKDSCTCKENRAAPKTLKVGDYVSWSDGLSKGEVMEIVEDGSISVPNSSVTINGTFSDPAALVAVYEETENGWIASGAYVGKKFSSLMRINKLPNRTNLSKKNTSRITRMTHLTKCVRSI